MARRVGAKRRRVEHGELGRVRRQANRILFPDEHVAREQVVPCRLGDDPNRQLILRVGAGVSVSHVQFLLAEMRQQVAMERLERLRRQRAVHRAPPEVLLARRLANDELVVRRPARVRRRLAHERPRLGDGTLAPPNRSLDKRRDAEIPVDGGSAGEALGVETDARRDLGGHVRIPYPDSKWADSMTPLLSSPGRHRPYGVEGARPYIGGS